ncbi:hypothetical protein DPEC_G00342630 [Dallia pectoralis]|uniref:Uncharacterized protein n=1 Tax=Dallia pectoralis TaxID=75939 RepID=A0ACC2F5X4_DALPE|nr:hypothetical protein DPEC_G00342630 [Dallia pectoralis]
MLSVQQIHDHKAKYDFTTQLWPPPSLPAWFSHCSLLFNHSHLDAVSACFAMLFTKFLRVAPLTPSIPNALQSDCPGNPLQPTSTGRFQALQPPAGSQK